jgi:hypothetical protein
MPMLGNQGLLLFPLCSMLHSAPCFPVFAHHAKPYFSLFLPRVGIRTPVFVTALFGLLYRLSTLFFFPSSYFPFPDDIILQVKIREPTRCR